HLCSSQGPATTGSRIASMREIFPGSSRPYFRLRSASCAWTASVVSDMFLLPNGSDGGGKRHRVEGLGDHAQRADVPISGNFVRLNFGGHEDDRNRRGGGVGAKRLERRRSVHHAHHHIH